MLPERKRFFSKSSLVNNSKTLFSPRIFHSRKETDTLIIISNGPSKGRSRWKTFDNQSSRSQTKLQLGDLIGKCSVTQTPQ